MELEDPQNITFTLTLKDSQIKKSGLSTSGIKDRQHIAYNLIIKYHVTELQDIAYVWPDPQN